MASGQIRDVGCSNPQAEERQTGPQCIGMAREMTRLETAYLSLRKRAAMLGYDADLVEAAIKREQDDVRVAAIVARELGEEE